MVLVARTAVLGTLLALVSTGCGASAGAAPRVHRFVIGHSVHGRPIDAFEVGDPGGPLKELVVGYIRAVHRLIVRVRPQISIWFHQHQDLVDLSGGKPSIERRFAELVELPVRRLPRDPGSVTSWENSVLPGTTAFVVELPAGELPKTDVVRFADAALDIAG